MEVRLVHLVHLGGEIKEALGPKDRATWQICSGVRLLRPHIGLIPEGKIIISKLNEAVIDFMKYLP